MSEFGPERKIRYRRVACPHCGNDVTAKSVKDEQKCPFCKRKYKINFLRRGKKVFWEPEAIDYIYEQMRFAGF